MTGLPARMSERLVLGEAIGRGSCSTVYRAHDRLLDRDVAIKVFPVAADPRAEREVALMASLDHPGLVPVYDLEQADGHAYVVTALFDGSLADRIAADGPIPVGAALLLTASVAEALAHVHRAGVLHRDVVPRNILFDSDGRAHLSDFGVATVADAPRLTDTGVVVGSAPYLAPELLRGGTAGPTSDVYSLGLVLIEALTGRRAYEGAPLEAAEARLTRRPPTPSGVGPEVIGTLEAMTADESDDRPGADVVCVRLRRAALAAETVTPGRGLRPMAVTASPVAAHEDSGMGSAARYGRSAAVLAAAAVSIMVAGGAVVASAWPVQSVSATMPPMASAAPPAAVAPLLPPPGESSGGSSGSDSGDSSDDSGSSSGSDSGSGSVEQARDSGGSTDSSSERSAGSSGSGSERAARPSPATRSATAKPSAPKSATPKSATPKSATPKSAPAEPVAPRIAPTQAPSDDTEDRSDEVQTIQDKVEDTADAAREKARDKADAARERAQDKADAAKDRLQDTTDDEDSTDSTDSAGDSTSNDSDDSPTTTTRPRPGLLDPAVRALKPVTGLLGG